MSAEKKKPRPAARAVSRPLALLGIMLFISIFVMLGSLLYVGNKRADLQKHVELASEQLLLSQLMTTQALGASSGRESDFEALLDSRYRFEKIQNSYRSGDPMSAVPPLGVKLTVPMERVEEIWSKFNNDISTILNGKKPVSEVRELYTVIDSFIPQLLTFSDEVVGVLMKKGASSRQIYLATRQMMLSQRIKNNLNQVLAGGEQAAAAADRFGRDAALFGRVLEGLLKGSSSLNIEKVTDKEAVAKLREVAMLISAVSDNIAGILELSPELFEVKDAASRLTTESASLLAELREFQTSHKHWT
jgi:twitching motility protein PilJ